MRDVVQFQAATKSMDAVGGAIMAFSTGAEIPCIEEAVFAREFYQAEATGYRPEVRIKVNKRSYAGEPRFVFKGEWYSVIRTEKARNDWLIIVGQSVVNEEARDV